MHKLTGWKSIRYTELQSWFKISIFLLSKFGFFGPSKKYIVQYLFFPKYRGSSKKLSVKYQYFEKISIFDFLTIQFYKLLGNLKEILIETSTKFYLGQLSKMVPKLYWLLQYGPQNFSVGNLTLKLSFSLQLKVESKLLLNL